MKDEIKEILELLKEDLYIPQEDNREYKLLGKGDDKLLLDYITNLQQIEQDHQRINGELRKENNKLQEENEKAMKLLKEFYDSVNYDEIIALLEKYEQFKGLKEGK